MKRFAVINVVGLTGQILGSSAPHITRFASQGKMTTIQPAFPAVTCTAQSTYLTGLPPTQHGIVANGWYHRELSEVQFWKQSNHLVHGQKIWEAMREINPNFTCAKLFWWYNMYSTADYSITPRPMYPADGRKIFDIYTHPMSLRTEIKKELGEFPFPSFWGPMAGIPSSSWIAESAKWVEEHHHPTLSLIYLPHLDYNLQRLGPSDPAVQDDIRKIDAIVGDLISFFQKQSIEVILLSEYGITEVNRPIHLNRLFRKQGWITIKDELGLELLDCGASRVFAVADHQVAHIYLNDRSLEKQVRDLLQKQNGIDKVLSGEDLKTWKINHPRAGDLVAVSDSRSWFTYYYWLEDALAPDFARCVDIHRKPGYDPVELFLDPHIHFPKLKIAKFLLSKKMGFRTLLNVIPLDATLVKGSHGRIPENTDDHPVLIFQNAKRNLPTSMDSTEVYPTLIDLLTG